MFLRWVWFLVIFFTIDAKSQWYDPEKVKPKATAIYNDAIALAQDDKWNEAKKKLLAAFEVDNKLVDALLSYAGICGENKQYDSAVLMYEKARLLDSVYFNDYNLPYSIDLAGLGRFTDAMDAVRVFTTGSRLSERSLKAADYRRKAYQFALDMKKDGKDLTGKFSPQNLGANINTKDLEYFPSLPIEGNKLVFTRRLGGMNEDFYESEKTAGTWSKAKPLVGVNTEANEGAQCISQDGEWLVFTGCNRPNGFGSCDIFISYRMPDGSWSPAENMGPNINTEYWESAPCLSPDKNDLYFSSRRSDGYGAGDIWVSHRNAKGKWMPAENLGQTVNTPGEESCPFIHPDNQTLYLTSDGLQGYGGSDLFLTRKGPGGAWSVPQNLGYPINTIDNEGSLVVTAEGATAYYASDRKESSLGGMDIYSFDLPVNIRPVRTLWVKGKVFDAKTKQGLPSSVELRDMVNGVIVENLQTDESGNFLVTLPVGKNYSFTVNRKGYLFFSDNYALQNNPADSVYKKDIPLEPMIVNTVMEIQHLLYENNSYQLNPSSFVELDKIVRLLKENPLLKIQIGGHTDNVGKPADNLKLSNSRAKAVVDYLVSKGIVATRLSFIGYGSSKPIADNGAERGRAKNRRTELLVTAN